MKKSLPQVSNCIALIADMSIANNTVNEELEKNSEHSSCKPLNCVQKYYRDRFYLFLYCLKIPGCQLPTN